MRTTTGTDAVTYRHGERAAVVSMALTEAEWADVHYALWLAYGNHHRPHPIWEKLRQALGEDGWQRVVANSALGPS